MGIKLATSVASSSRQAHRQCTSQSSLHRILTPSRPGPHIRVSADGRQSSHHALRRGYSQDMAKGASELIRGVQEYVLTSFPTFIKEVTTFNFATFFHPSHEPIASLP